MDYSTYKELIARTGGDIYIGVVGPVRTGKSTFIKKFMETLVLPAIQSDGVRQTRRLRRTGRRCGDMRMLLHKCILRIKGHGAVFAAIGAIRKHQACLCRVPQLRI